MVASVTIYCPLYVVFVTAWVSDGSTSKYQTRHMPNTPTAEMNPSHCSVYFPYSPRPRVLLIENSFGPKFLVLLEVPR